MGGAVRLPGVPLQLLAVGAMALARRAHPSAAGRSCGPGAVAAGLGRTRGRVRGGRSENTPEKGGVQPGVKAGLVNEDDGNRLENRSDNRSEAPWMKEKISGNRKDCGGWAREVNKPPWLFPF